VILACSKTFVQKPIPENSMQWNSLDYHIWSNVETSITDIVQNRWYCWTQMLQMQV